MLLLTEIELQHDVMPESYLQDAFYNGRISVAFLPLTSNYVRRKSHLVQNDSYIMVHQ